MALFLKDSRGAKISTRNKTDQVVDRFFNAMKDELLGLSLLCCLNCGEDGKLPTGGHLTKKKYTENGSSVRPCNFL